MTIIAMAQAENDKEAVRIEYDPKSDVERREATRRLLDFWRREYEEAFGARDESETAVYPYLITYRATKNGETCFETVERNFSHRPPTYAELESMKQAERETWGLTTCGFWRLFRFLTEWRLTAMFHNCASCVHNPVCNLKGEKSKLESVVSERFKGFSGEHFRINVNCNHFQGTPRLCQSDINLCSVNAASNLKTTARTQYERDYERALREKESGLLNAATADYIMSGATACMSLGDMYAPD